VRGNWLALILLKGDVVLFSFDHCDFSYATYLLTLGASVWYCGVCKLLLKHRVSIVTLWTSLLLAFCADPDSYRDCLGVFEILWDGTLKWGRRENEREKKQGLLFLYLLFWLGHFFLSPFPIPTPLTETAFSFLKLFLYFLFQIFF